MRVCSCDPDTETPAFALFENKKLIDYIALTGKKGLWLHAIPSLIDTWHPDLLVIENQFLPLGKTNHARSVFSLVAARGMISGVFLLSKIPIHLLEPFTWQRALGGSRIGREHLKSRSFIKASAIAGHNIENEHVADAIVMGDFWVATHPLVAKNGQNTSSRKGASA